MKIKKINRTENKKGILMPEAMKIIIAVLCILLLLYLAYRLYSSMVSVTPMKQAEANLEEIINKAELVSKDGINREVLLYNPRDWVLVGWPNTNLGVATVATSEFDFASINYYGKEDIPIFCKENGWKKCVCLCEFKPLDILSGCNNAAICKSSDFNYDIQFLGISPEKDFSSRILVNDLADNKETLLIVRHAGHIDIKRNKK